MQFDFFLLGRRAFSTFRKKIMESTGKNTDYEACIEALNKLQSNAQYIKAVTNPPPSDRHNGNQLLAVKKYLQRVGLSLDNLDELSVIHVAGTKGKGTTCAFSERILREHGFKTGFYSSPHLVEVRERIRINGKPIDKEEFTEYFWHVYKKLQNHEDDMPLYFRFLTILAFFIFLQKKVDVAVVEVGIGGEYDCTNVLRKVPVVGITSLGIDHVSLLGNSLEEIAWHKAGIMKEGCKAFTVPQPEAALDVLKQRSVEKKCQLETANSLQFQFPPNNSTPAHILNANASLAVALCEAWISIKHNNNLATLSKEKTEHALFNCTWPGRFQTIPGENISYYLDGAHTLESISACCNWFKDVTKSSTRKKALMFNITGDRDAKQLLSELQTCSFDVVLFVTNVATVNRNTSDNSDLLSLDHVLKRCYEHQKIWSEQTNGPSRVFPAVAEALEFMKNQDECDVLVTGSIHLVGSVLSLMEPDLNK